MADNLPARRISRDVLERVIQRAAELQAGELDTGEGLTEAELLKVGAEVGIDGRFLRQALYEQHSHRPGERGALARWFGPATVGAGRVVPGEKAAIEAALAHWMADGEAMAVKRRLPDRTVWERQKGFFAEVKRGFGVGGKAYQLARALDVTVIVTQLEPGFCHVELSADLSAQRSGSVAAALGSGGALALVGAAMMWVTGRADVPIAQVVALVPFGAAALTPVLAGRMQRTRAGHMTLALEQVLDRLEHGEIKPRHREEPSGLLPVARIVDEVRRAIAQVSDAAQARRRIPPSR